MKESAMAALSYVRAHGKDLGVPDGFLQKNDIHIHVPAGAIPKDGPSAGVTMTSALASLVTGRKIRPRVAMTGEITLTGRVLPVGGIKEKALAARRAGIKELIIPARNKKDVDEDIPDQIKDSLKFHFVSEISQVLALALETEPEALPGKPDTPVKEAKKPAPRRASARKKEPVVAA
jgi:ATP-dependent Lon protease